MLFSASLMTMLRVHYYGHHDSYPRSYYRESDHDFGDSLPFNPSPRDQWITNEAQAFINFSGEHQRAQVSAAVH